MLSRKGARDAQGEAGIDGIARTGAGGRVPAGAGPSAPAPDGADAAHGTLQRRGTGQSVRFAHPDGIGASEADATLRIHDQRKTRTACLLCDRRTSLEGHHEMHRGPVRGRLAILRDGWPS